MKVVRKLNEPTDEITDIFCNKCGQSCQSPEGDFYGLIEQVVIGGYSSNHSIKDYDVHKFSICDRCLSELVSSFIYPSYQGNLMFRDEENEAPDFDPTDYSSGGVEFFDANNPAHIDLISSFIEEMDEPIAPENDELELVDPLKKKEEMH